MSARPLDVYHYGCMYMHECMYIYMYVRVDLYARVDSMQVRVYARGCVRAGQERRASVRRLVCITMYVCECVRARAELWLSSANGLVNGKRAHPSVGPLTDRRWAAARRRPLTHPLTANGRMHPWAVSGLAELRAVAHPSIQCASVSMLVPPDVSMDT
jgi:hypothetical protein